MKCGNHPEIEAIAACRQCGRGVCKKCAEKSDYVSSSLGVICIDCYAELCALGVKISKKNLCNSLLHLIINIVLFIIGAHIAIPAYFRDGEPDYLRMIIGFAIGGFYGIIENWRSESAKQARREAKYGVKYTAYIDCVGGVVLQRDSNLFYRLCSMFLAVLLAPLTALIRIFLYIDLIVVSSSKTAFYSYELEHAHDC